MVQTCIMKCHSKKPASTGNTTKTNENQRILCRRNVVTNMEHAKSSAKTVSGETRQKCFVHLEGESPSERNRHMKKENAEACGHIVFLRLFWTSQSLKPHCRLCKNAKLSKPRIFQEPMESGTLRCKSGCGPRAIRFFCHSKSESSKIST